jgi:hypothetical protein
VNQYIQDLKEGQYREELDLLMPLIRSASNMIETQIRLHAGHDNAQSKKIQSLSLFERLPTARDLAIQIRYFREKLTGITADSEE